MEGSAFANERRHHLWALREAEQRNLVAPFQRHIGASQSGRDSPVNPREPIDRLAHRLAAIESENDLIVALALVFPCVEVVVAGACPPINSPAIHPRFVLGQSLELSAFAADAPGDQAGLRIAQECLQLLGADRGKVGPDAHRLAEFALRLTRTLAQRACPAQPGANNIGRAAARGVNRGAPLMMAFVAIIRQIEPNRSAGC